MKASVRIVLIAWVGLLGGCASTRPVPGPAGVSGEASVGARVGGPSYEVLFDATREVLGEARFAINRVDAARGVITTFPKRTAGLASPWDKEQSSLGQEWEDLVNQQQRLVRVRFERGDQGEGGEAVATVEVELLRTHRPYWRVEPESVRLSTHAGSRDRQGDVIPSSFEEVIGLDQALADRLARAIREKIVTRAQAANGS